MNLNRLEGIALVEDVLAKITSINKTEIIFAPSFMYLDKVSEMIVDIPNVFTSSQDCSENDNGAFTGEVSACMIASCKAKYIILGHSERRVNFRETHDQIKRKVRQALLNDLQVIFCCGESLEQRESGVYFDWIKNQISDSLFHLSPAEFENIIIAYEPIWAIGTGVTASTNQAQEIHAFIRKLLTIRYTEEVAESTSILYGGSCNPGNAKELFACKDIDGGLIGGASLDADSFLAISQSF